MPEANCAECGGEFSLQWIPFGNVGCSEECAEKWARDRELEGYEVSRSRYGYLAYFQPPGSLAKSDYLALLDTTPPDATLDL